MEETAVSYTHLDVYKRQTLTERYSKERYRKFVETLLDNKNAALWPDVARYVARLPEIQAAGQPQKVMLLAKWSDILRQDDGTFTRAPWDEHVFYSYDVKPEDCLLYTSRCV